MSNGGAGESGPIRPPGIERDGPERANSQARETAARRPEALEGVNRARRDGFGGRRQRVGCGFASGLRIEIR
jgi:hypothetical protein